MFASLNGMISQFDGQNRHKKAVMVPWGAAESTAIDGTLGAWFHRRSCNPLRYSSRDVSWYLLYPLKCLLPRERKKNSVGSTSQKLTFSQGRQYFWGYTSSGHDPTNESEDQKYGFSILNMGPWILAHPNQGSHFDVFLAHTIHWPFLGVRLVRPPSAGDPALVEGSQRESGEHRKDMPGVFWIGTWKRQSCVRPSRCYALHGSFGSSFTSAR